MKKRIGAEARRIAIAAMPDWVDPSKIFAARQTHEASVRHARGAAMYALAKTGDYSLQSIGALFNLKDHTSVMRAVTCYRAEILREPEAIEQHEKLARGRKLYRRSVRRRTLRYMVFDTETVGWGSFVGSFRARGDALAVVEQSEQALQIIDAWTQQIVKEG